jgi:DNA polymerase III subunit delta'
MIVGHQKIINFLNKSLKKNAVSHAYIFSGPENLGKFSLAFDFAQKLTGNDAEINPDIIIVKPDIKENKGISKEDIKIEKIRELQHQLSMTSHFGKRKVAIIDSADRMNKSAQNALLKTLEEPAEKIVLVLIARDINKLFPTIISRCVNKKFSLVSDSEIEKMLPSGEKNSEEIIFWSLGRPGLAQKIAEDIWELEKRRKAEKELSAMLDLNVSDKLAIAEKMSSDAGKLIETLNSWTILLRRDLLGHEKIIPASREKLACLISRTEKSIELVRETNSNVRLVLENLLLDF